VKESSTARTLENNNTSAAAAGRKDRIRVPSGDESQAPRPLRCWLWCVLSFTTMKIMSPSSHAGAALPGRRAAVPQRGLAALAALEGARGHCMGTDACFPLSARLSLLHFLPSARLSLPQLHQSLGAIMSAPQKNHAASQGSTGFLASKTWTQLTDSGRKLRICFLRLSGENSS